MPVINCLSSISSTILDSLLDNQFGELLSSAMDFLNVCFGMNFNGLSYDDFCNLPKFGAGICKAEFSLGGFDKLFPLFIKSENNKTI